MTVVLFLLKKTASAFAHSRQVTLGAPTSVIAIVTEMGKNVGHYITATALYINFALLAYYYYQGLSRSQKFQDFTKFTSK